MKKSKIKNQNFILKFYLINFFVLISILFCSMHLFAETIYLKSGKTVEGKIVERTDRYIKIEFQGIPLTYFNEDIERIEGATNITTSIMSQPSSGLQAGRYENKEYGFSIIWPQGWFKRHEGFDKGAFTITYAKHKEPSPVMDLPIFSVMVLPPHPTAKTPLEIANQVFSQWKSGEARYEIAESPTEVEINGIRGARFLWDKPAWDRFKNQEFWVRMLNVYFIKEDKVFYFTLFDRREEFEDCYKEIQDSLQTLRFISSNPNVREEFNDLKELNKIQIEFKPVNIQLYDSLKTQILANMKAKNTYNSLFILKDITNEELAKKDFINMEWLMTFISPESFEIFQTNHSTGEVDIWRIDGEEIYIQIGAWIPMPMQTDSPEFIKMIKVRKEIYKILSFEKYLELLKKEMPVGIAEDVQNRYLVIKFKLPIAEELFTGRLREGDFASDILIWSSTQDKTIRFVKTIIEGRDKDNKEIKEEYEHFFGNYNATLKLGKPEMPWMQEKK